MKILTYLRFVVLLGILSCSSQQQQKQVSEALEQDQETNEAELQQEDYENQEDYASEYADEVEEPAENNYAAAQGNANTAPYDDPVPVNQQPAPEAQNQMNNYSFGQTPAANYGADAPPVPVTNYGASAPGYNPSQGAANPYGQNQALPLNNQNPLPPANTPQTSEVATAPSAPPAAPAAPPPPRPKTPEEQIAEVLPAASEVRWIGYDYRVKEKSLIVEVIWDGKGTYKVFQETNLNGQPELVLRFLGATIREKINKDLDASEFYSPVAYIRVRESKVNNWADIVLTFREEVKGTFEEKDGTIKLTYPIPEHYFSSPGHKAVAEAKATKLSDADLLSFNIVAEKAPPPTAPAPADNAVPIENVIDQSNQIDAEGFPASYGNESAPTADYGTNGAAPAAEDSGEVIPVEASGYGDAPAEEENSYEGDAPAEGDGGENAPAEEGDNYEGYQSNGGNEGTEDSNEEAPAEEYMQNGGDFSFLAVAQYDLQSASGNAGNSAPSNYGATNAPANNAYGNYGGNAIQVQDETTPQAAPDVPIDQGAPLAQPDDYSDVEAQPSETPAQQFSGRPTSVEFHEAPLNLVLKTFEQESGNNFIFPRDIGDILVTMRLKDVPWDEALKAVLETYGLGMVQVGPKIARIDRIENLTGYLQKLNDTNRFKVRLEPTKILVVRLNNAQAEVAIPNLTSLLAADMTNDPRIKLSADKRTNTVVAEAPPPILTKIKSVLDRIDLETPQVEIKGRIVEVSKSDNDFFGVAWGNNFNFDPGRGLGFGSLNFPNSLTSNFSVDPGVSGGGRAGNLSVKLGSINRFLDLDLFLAMESKKGTAKILQDAKSVVLDREPASIQAGSQDIVTQTDVINGVPTTRLVTIDYLLKLEATPEVTASDLVNLKLDISSDIPNTAVSQGAISTKVTRRQSTKMSLASGETGVIGGIYDNKKSKAVTGIPILSSIPIIGALFRSTNTIETQTELLIMITPTILNGNGKKVTDGGSSGNFLEDNAGTQENASTSDGFISTNVNASNSGEQAVEDTEYAEDQEAPAQGQQGNAANGGNYEQGNATNGGNYEQGNAGAQQSNAASEQGNAATGGNYEQGGSNANYNNQGTENQAQSNGGDSANF
ncbi:MAG: secretin N-terminal domain-containing protein [Oligoflexales bacterium]